MSEYVVANIVNYERDLFNVYDNKKCKTWSRPGKILKHRSISELTIGILGIGTIGNHSKLLFFCPYQVLFEFMTFNCFSCSNAACFWGKNLGLRKK